VLFFVLWGLGLFYKGDFCHVNVSRMIFQNGNFGGVQHFHSDSYLNDTTVPFDSTSVLLSLDKFELLMQT